MDGWKSKSQLYLIIKNELLTFYGSGIRDPTTHTHLASVINLWHVMTKVSNNYYSLPFYILHSPGPKFSGCLSLTIPTALLGMLAKVAIVNSQDWSFSSIVPSKPIVPYDSHITSKIKHIKIFHKDFWRRGGYLKFMKP